MMRGSHNVKLRKTVSFAYSPFIQLPLSFSHVSVKTMKSDHCPSDSSVSNTTLRPCQHLQWQRLVNDVVYRGGHTSIVFKRLLLA